MQTNSKQPSVRTEQVLRQKFADIPRITDIVLHDISRVSRWHVLCSQASQDVYILSSH